MLTTLSMDANDSLYPIAFALVEIENGHNWRWFMEALQASLDLENGATVTMMSDMQKVHVLELCFDCYVTCVGCNI